MTHRARFPRRFSWDCPRPRCRRGRTGSNGRLSIFALDPAATMGDVQSRRLRSSLGRFVSHGGPVTRGSSRCADLSVSVISQRTIPHPSPHGAMPTSLSQPHAGRPSWAFCQSGPRQCHCDVHLPPRLPYPYAVCNFRAERSCATHHFSAPFLRYHGRRPRQPLHKRQRWTQTLSPRRNFSS